ncbi:MULTISPECIES: hypothetical protein [unclassified Mesorhizobium]|uniref:hypothetical protein n=1 Tax=unclassified Mesorhizobium TaxID=325217 RepID=UPI00333916E8
MSGRFVAFILTMGLMIGSAAGQTDAPPLTSSEASASIALPLKEKTDGSLDVLSPEAVLTSGAIWLHSKGKTDCYYLYDEHYYETKTTTGKDINSQPVNVDSLTLHFQVGGDSGDQTCNSTSICAKTIKEYNMYCRTPRCVYATATVNGSTWSTTKACW